MGTFTYTYPIGSMYGGDGNPHTLTYATPPFLDANIPVPWAFG